MLRDRINTVARRLPEWPLYIAGALPPLWLLASGLTDNLGADPVKAMERQMGIWALQLLIAGLCITPFRRFVGINLLKFRRAIGLVAFSYVVLHFLIWLVLDMGLLWGQVLADIYKRPYLTMGMVALVALIPLAATSNRWSIRKLGAAGWQRLHRLVYLAALAGGLHYVWLVKAWPLEPFLYLGAILGLLALRFVPVTRRRAAESAAA